MGMKTGIIRYNVKERGRRFRGQDRNFDTVALAAIVNGNEVQERVKSGDLLGYYGHWPRVKFGMDVQEGAMVGGKVVHLEPAIRTTSIKAYEDGTIEHEAEFLDTAPGRLASRMFASKAGGFSSAINAPRRGSMQVPDGFFGFDYVLEPNYTTNRGYALDSAGNRIDPEGLPEDEQLILDEVAQYTALVESTSDVLDRVQAEFDQQAAVVVQLHEENVEYQSKIAQLQAALDSARSGAMEGKPEDDKAAKPEVVNTAALDAADVGAYLPGETRFHRASEFKTAPLEDYDKGRGDADAPKTAADSYFARRGWGR